MAEFRILGPLEVIQDGQVRELGPPKQRALLAILLLNANDVVPVDRLIDELWGERPPRRAAHAIQVYVSELRRILGAKGRREAIEWRPPGYVLIIDPAQLDAHVAEELVAKGTAELEAGDWVAAGGELSRARSLWRGTALSDFVYEEFAQADIHHLNDVWLRGTEALARVRFIAGNAQEALTLAEAAIREDPYREQPRQIQMRALYSLGREADALRSYQAYRDRLVDELGTGPAPSLRNLHERILVHDPQLAIPDRADPNTPLARRSHRSAIESPAEGPIRNPYKGLRAFDEQDARDFFGRRALVARIVAVMAGGVRLVTLVGPSGSGKSSVLAAGVVPAVRGGAVNGSATWLVRRLRPGATPLAALQTALCGDGPATDRLLVIDQLEEAFNVADTTETDRFLDALADAVESHSPRVRAVVALRADSYDRPLLHARFAAAFQAGLVNVVPMTAAELEAAIVEPARGVGVDVEQDLLAELISESVDRPGILPLLQHVLSELFEQRQARALTLTDYHGLGSLRGALSRGAEEVFNGLDADGQAIARQVALRLVSLEEGQRTTTRRASVGELADLGLDPVALSDVLRRFESERLLTFDRDQISGGTTVEVAHEALISEWPRMGRWIEESRLDLHRHSLLSARVHEWIAGDRRDDDLLTGRRLSEFDAWARESSLRLTADEASFLRRSLERQRLAEITERAREQRQRGLERGARLRLGAFVAVAALLVLFLAYAAIAWPGAAPEVALVYPGPGDNGMYDSIKRGFDEGVARLGLDAVTVIEPPVTLRDRLHRLADQGVRLIVVGYWMSNPDVEVMARDHPGTRFLATDYVGALPNVWHPRYAFEQGAFLVGAAAGLRSEAGNVGVIALEDSNLDWPFSGGFETGARLVDPGITIQTVYLTGPIVFRDVTFADVNRAARAMYRAGADVVFYSGHQGQLGLFEAAASESTSQGRQLWAIGAETDWHLVLPYAASLEQLDAATWGDHALTSLIIRFDLGVSSLLGDYGTGGTPRSREFGLADGAFELSSSGGFIDAFRPRLDALRGEVEAGQIIVPEYPADRGPAR